MDTRRDQTAGLLLLVLCWLALLIGYPGPPTITAVLDGFHECKYMHACARQQGVLRTMVSFFLKGKTSSRSTT